MILHHVIAYSCLAAWLFLIVAKREPLTGIGIWSDIDALFVRGALQFARFLGAGIPQLNEPTRLAAQRDRIFAGRMACAGALLLATFPFHRAFLTDGFVDWVWTPFQAIASHAQRFNLDSIIHIAPDWREQEYYLWEIAAFLWTMFQLGSSHIREIFRILRDRLMDPTAAFVFGITYLLVAGMLALFGVLVLMVAVSLYVLLFEVLVVAMFFGIELYLARILYLNHRNEHANRGIESALFIELPALLAFILAALFVGGAEGFTYYSSHWSHAFASGASALDLVLANVGLLMIRTFRRPPVEPDDED